MYKGTWLRKRNQIIYRRTNTFIYRIQINTEVFLPGNSKSVFYVRKSIWLPPGGSLLRAHTRASVLAAPSVRLQTGAQCTDRKSLKDRGSGSRVTGWGGKQISGPLWNALWLFQLIRKPNSTTHSLARKWYPRCSEGRTFHLSNLGPVAKSL